MSVAQKTIAFAVVLMACESQRPALQLQPDAGSNEVFDGADGNDFEITPNESTVDVIEPEDPVPEVVGRGERCTPGVNECESSLVCSGGFCLGNTGWACEAHSDCAEYLRCRDGQCQLPVRIDGTGDTSCVSNADCADEEAACVDGRCAFPLGYWCNNSTDCVSGLSCFSGQCQIPEDGICESHNDCVWRTLCLDFDGAGLSHCTRQELYGPCRFDAQCGAGQLCDAGACLTASGVACTEETCVGGARCVPLGNDLHYCAEPAIGRGCDENTDCPSEAVCVEGRCGLGLFASCTSQEECHPGLTCDELAGMCLRQEGAVCEEGECVGSFTCRPTLLADGLNRCLEPQVGSPCEESEDCPADTDCRGDRCVRGIGELCARDSHCESGRAVCQPDRDSDCTGVGCSPRFCYLVDSAPCNEDNECAWGLNCVPVSYTNPEGAHICRPRIPGVGCNDVEDCPSGVPCLGNACGNCGLGVHCYAPEVCGGHCSGFCCPPANPVGCLHSCAPEDGICYSEAVDLTQPFGMLSALEGAWNTEEYRSPNLLYNGEYDPVRDMRSPNPDEDNWVNPWVNRYNPDVTLEPGDEVLVADAVWVKETMEGEECPHGPFGKLYLMTHTPDFLDQTPAYCGHCSSSEICLNVIRETAINDYKRLRLRGPFRGPPACCYSFLFWEKCSPPPSDEFVDSTYLRYRAGLGGVHKWQTGETEIALSIVESDTDNTDDLAGPVVVSREATRTPCGAWVSFRQYEPVTWGAYPDGTFGQDVCIGQLDLYPVVLRLRTITCTGNPADPC